MLKVVHIKNQMNMKIKRLLQKKEPEELLILMRKKTVCLLHQFLLKKNVKKQIMPVSF